MELNVADALRGIQFLRDSSDDLIDELASVAQVVEFSDGSVIFRQGDTASTMYLVVEGNVSLEICAPGVGCKRILTVGRGELLGWSPVLEQSRLTATARTLSGVQAIAFSGPQIIAICEQNPRFGYWFMKRAAMALAKRLNATRLQLLDVFGTKMPAAADERTAEMKT
jgi:CRP/FNR family transcriptional regulator, cyclic AMP receptor protein